VNDVENKIYECQNHARGTKPHCPGCCDEVRGDLQSQLAQTREALEAVENHYAILCEVLCASNPPPGGYPVLLKIRAALANLKKSSDG